jgi:hypothetical protein
LPIPSNSITITNSKYRYKKKTRSAMLLPSLPLVCLFALLVAVYTVTTLIRCLASPLRKIPGPFPSLFTSLALKYHELQADRTRYIHDLHKRYGPVVRIAPNEVVFTGLEAVREIYGSAGSGFDKTEFYNIFRIFGRRFVWTSAVYLGEVATGRDEDWKKLSA